MNQIHPSWASIDLGTLATEMCLGKMLDKAKNTGELQPYLRNVNVRWFSFDLTDLKEMRFESGEDIRFGLLPGDLVVCEGGEPGRAAVWRGEASDAKIQKALHRIRFGANEYLPQFAMYFVYYATITNQLARSYTGSTIKHLTGRAFAKVEFPLPPFEEQERIVDKLDELFSEIDAGVESLKRVQANLKRYRASVLKSAVEGQLTEDWRAENTPAESGQQLLDRILNERRNDWEADQLTSYERKGKKPPKNWKARYKRPDDPDKSKLPKLPDGWVWATIDQLSNHVRYGSSSKTSSTANGVPVLRMGNIQDEGLDVSKLKYLPTDHSEFPDLLLQEGDLLFNRTNSAELVGKSAVYHGAPFPCSYASYLIGVRFFAGCLPEFVAYVLNSTYGRNWISSVVSQNVGQANVNGTKLKAFAIPLPPSDEQSAIVAEVEALASAIEQVGVDVKKGLVRASRLRQSILKDAFEGRLVAQDPADEPASELLARIKGERQRSAANGRPRPSANGSGKRSRAKSNESPSSKNRAKKQNKLGGQK